MKQPIPIHLPAISAPGHPSIALPPVSPQKSRAFEQQTTALGSRVIGITLGGAAIVLGAVSAVWLMTFAATLARDLGEGFRLVLVALAVAAILGGLPIAAAVLARNYPREGDAAMKAWRFTAVAAALAVCLVTLLPAKSGRPNASDRRPTFIPNIVWEYSDHCRNPENAYQAGICADFGDRGPAATASSGERIPGGRILAALIGIGALAGAGQIGRMAVLAMSESQRLVGGQAQALDVPDNPDVRPVMMPDVPLTPLQIFDMWFNGRVRVDPQGKLPATVAFDDYKAACQMNGYAALSQTKFGDLMGSKASNSGGRITKTKSNGTMVYNGLAIIGDRMAMDINADAYVAAPHRT